MSFLGLVIGTGIVWGLTALLVVPIAIALTRRRDRETRPVIGNGGETEQTATADEEIDTGYFILADVVVMAAAGFLIGWAVGWFFIGITWHARNWPGMIAFIITSLIGSAIHG